MILSSNQSVHGFVLRKAVDLYKAYVPPRQPVRFHQGRKLPPPEPKGEYENRPWQAEKEYGGKPDNVSPIPSRQYTPDTALKYYGTSNPAYGKDDIDPAKFGDARQADHAKARQNVHDAILHHFVHSRPIPESGEQKQAIFMMGGPAAGKSTMLEQMMSEEEIDRHVTINLDEIKNLLPEYRKGVRHRYYPAAGNVHEESSHLSKRIFDEAVRSGRHIIMDGTGANADKYIKQIEELKALGYRVKLFHLNKDKESGVDAALSRAYRSGRHVPTDVIRHTYDAIPNSFERVKNHVHEYHTFVARGPKEKPRLVNSVNNDHQGVYHTDL